MKELLHFEFDKLIRQKSFYICTLIASILTVVTTVSTHIISKGVGSTAWMNASNALQSSQLQTIFAIFIALFVCSEFTENTIKNIYSHGFSRVRVFFAKYVSSLVSMFVMYVFVTLVSFITGAIFFKIGAPKDIPMMLVRQGLGLIVFHSFYYMIAMIFTTQGTTLAINFVGPMMMSLVLAMIDNIVSLKSFHFTSFGLTEVMSNLKSTTSGDIQKGLLLAIFYIIAFIVIGLFFNKKKEF